MDRVLHHRARLGCGPERAFALFTTKAGLESWLAPRAEVEPRVGGRYELYWDPAHPEDNSTIGCKLTAFAPERLLAFEWKGPVPFRPFMNAADPLTQVTVCFIPSGSGTEVHLVHTGWRSGPEWDEARRWFERAWGEAFRKLAAVSATV